MIFKLRQFINYNGRVYFAVNEEGDDLQVLQENHYYPFGLTISDLSSSTDNRVNKYQYNGKEFQSEGNIGLLDYGARYYDPQVGRWWSVDPLAEVFDSWSVFNYTFNNPVRFIDPDGRSPDDFVFDENGDFVRIDETNEPDRIVVEHSESCAIVCTAKFNDPKEDTKSIRNGQVSHIMHVSKGAINQVIRESGSINQSESKWKYIERESRPAGDASLFSGISDGNLDHVVSSSIIKNNNYLFLVKAKNKTTAYNKYDFGNFLWGHSGMNLGFSIDILRQAAHVNNALNGQKDNPGIPVGLFDSWADQKAIIEGYFYPGLPPKWYIVPNSSSLLTYPLGSVVTH